MRAYRILQPCSGAHDKFGLDVHHYRPQEVVQLPDHLGPQWVAAGIAEAVADSEARSTKVVAPPETKPAAPASYKDSKGETVSTVSVKRKPLKKKR